MKVCAHRFNTYLMMGVMLASVCGCKTPDKKPKEVSALRVHLQASPSEAGETDTVSVLRADPLSVTIEHEPILTEANVVAAKLIDSPGGFAVEVQFDESGTLMLEQYTAANPGRHLVIYGQWGNDLAHGRWLAAPLITQRISNGQLAFTPDITRKEADRLVLGLNNVAAKDKKS
jgi:preprotein translocase subunit SecD